MSAGFPLSRNPKSQVWRIFGLFYFRPQRGSLHDSIYSRLTSLQRVVFTTLLTFAACRFTTLESCDLESCITVQRGASSPCVLVSAPAAPPSAPPSLYGLATASTPRHNPNLHSHLALAARLHVSHPKQRLSCAAILTYSLTRAARTGDATQTRLRRRIPSPGLQSSDLPPPPTYTLTPASPNDCT